MPYDGTQWDESSPTNSTLANEIDDVARDMKVAVRSRMALEHVFPTSQTGTSEGGRHTYLTFQAQTAVPSMPVVASLTQAGMLFVSSGNLTYQNSAGTTVTMVNSAGVQTIVGAIYSATGTNGQLIIGSSGGALTILAPATTSGQVLVSSATAAPSWGFPTGLGTWGSVSGNSTSQATSDGFFVMSLTGQGGNFITLKLLSDNNATPSTIRAATILSLTGAVGQMVSHMIPVRKNDYYSSIVSGGNGSGFGYFISIGT